MDTEGNEALGDDHEASISPERALRESLERLERGLLAQSLASARCAVELATGSNDRLVQATAILVSAHALWESGQRTEALGHLRTAQRLFSEEERPQEASTIVRFLETVRLLEHLSPPGGGTTRKSAPNETSAVVGPADPDAVTCESASDCSGSDERSVEQTLRRSSVLAASGELDDALAGIREAKRLARRDGDDQNVLVAIVMHIEILQDLGRFDEALSVLPEISQEASRRGFDASSLVNEIELEIRTRIGRPPK